ncbi:MAG: carboxypeptidase-like regulatory domain-containing protein [Clostridia bacterium]|nr:carboxypeptidase-like regulatory domain-containing protein [Clostridia bacterium]
MISGYVRNKDNEPLEGVSVELKDSGFNTRIASVTDENGYFEFSENSGVYPFLTAVKEYGKDYLEYWAHNVDLSGGRSFDIRIGTNEIYGLGVHSVDGARYPLFLYFRPMNLKKYLAGDSDIAPGIADDSVCVKVDDVETDVFSLQRIKECVSEDGDALTAYLVQLKTPSSRWERIQIEICDLDGEVGMATVFNPYCISRQGAQF